MKKKMNIGIDPHFNSSSSIIGSKYIMIGNCFSGGKNLKLHAFDNFAGDVFFKKPELVIGNAVTITDNCYISCANKIEISDGVLLGENVFVTDNFHGDNSVEQIDTPPNQRPLKIGSPVYIGKNVWVGRNVCIMPGVTIGYGCVIGANSVVTHDIPAYSVAAGVPAKVIKTIE